MNESRVKITIFLMRLVDWILLISVFSVGTYAIIYAENGDMIALASLAGLFFVNRLGHFTNTKIASMRVNLDIEKRKLKQEMERERKR